MSKRDFIAAADLLFSDSDLKYAVLTMAITTRARHARPIKTIVLTFIQKEFLIGIQWCA